MAKESYEPAADNRFSILDKSGPAEAHKLALERMDTLRDYFHKCGDDLPGVHLGFGLYGSLTKGKKLRSDKLFGLIRGNVSNTDIDLAIYYDDAQLLEALQNKDTVVERSLDVYSRSQASLTSDTPEGAAARERIMDDYFSRKWYDLSQKVPHEMWVEQHSGPIGLTGSPHSIYATVTKLIESGAMPTLKDSDASGTETFCLKRRVARAFALDFLGGLKPYRQDFIRILLALETSRGERVWQYVAALITQWERLGNIPKKIEDQFPQTLADAARYYSVQ